jgi:hypothetical protein
MKKKKVALETRRAISGVYDDNIIRINKEGNEYYFEIGKELTADVAEAVTILIRKVEWDSPVWEVELKDIVSEEITPEKSLFWLTGGYSEWRTLEHYNKPWCDCYLDFQEEFGFLIVNIVKRSKKLKDIRDNFVKHLNLPILYDFAVSKNMIK